MPCEPRVDRDGFCCPGSSFRLFWDNRDRFRCPGSSFCLFLGQPGQNLIHLTPYRAMVAVGEWRNSGVLDLHISGVHGRACPGSPKEAEIPNRDSRICPGSYVDRLTPPPGHQPRIDRTLQCLAGMTISDDTRFLVRFATTSAPSQCENGIFSGVVSCRMRKILNQPPKRHIADSAELAGLRAMRSVVSECDSDNGRRQIAVSSH